jgi:hypothetical protein
MLLFSCRKDETAEVNITSDNNEISVSDDGYLKFDSQYELDNLLEEYIAAESGVVVKSGTGRKIPKRFVSITDLEEQKYKTKSGNESSIEIEETTLEEFNLACAKSLLKDPVLFNIFDTTLRLIVGDYFYKITDYGTFATKSGNEAELYTVIENFEQIKHDLNLSENDSTIIAVSPNVQFLNSFRGISPKKDILATEEDLNWKESKDQVSTKAMSDWISEYGIASFKWESRTGFGNLWYSIFGKDIKREKRYPSNARVTLELYDLDFIFWERSGIKIKVEKLKKCLFWTYWADQKATKFAVGFDKFEGEMTYNFPPSNMNYLAGDKYNKFSGYFNNIYKEILYRGYHSMDIVENWSSNILAFIPKIDVDLPFNLNTTIDNFIRNQVKDIIDYPSKQVYDWLKGNVNRYVVNPIQTELKSQIKSKSPMAMYVRWGTAKQTFVRSYITGVEEFGSGDSKVIRFNRSGGFSVGMTNGNFSLNRYKPMSFNLKDIDVFGAAYFEGHWRGVRMYK